MSDLRRRLLQDVVALLVRRIREEHVAYLAVAYLEDLGYDECPVCIANRQREAWA